MSEQGLFDPARLVFIDETFANTQMVRAVAPAANGWWTSCHKVIGRRSPSGHSASEWLDGIVYNRRRNDREEILDLRRALSCPNPKRNDIMMIDDLLAHKAAGVRKAIEARCDASLSAQIFPRSEPNRDAFQQAECLSAQGEASAQFLACAAASARSPASSPLPKPSIISGTQAMREIDRNLL